MELRRLFDGAAEFAKFSQPGILWIRGLCLPGTMSRNSEFSVTGASTPCLPIGNLYHNMAYLLNL